MCRPRTPAYARRRHKMGDKCIPAAPNQLLTGILASIMQSSCLFQAQSCGQCGMRAPSHGCAASPRGRLGVKSTLLDFSHASYPYLDVLFDECLCPVFADALAALRRSARTLCNMNVTLTSVLWKTSVTLLARSHVPCTIATMITSANTALHRIAHNKY